MPPGPTDRHHFAPTTVSVDTAIKKPDVGAGPRLKYSSPRPWVLALAISFLLWAGIGRAVWSLVH